MKQILDATCGFRMMWLDKYDPDTLYIDQRQEVNPDEVQDCRNLPYSDGQFKLIVCDLPHLEENRHTKGTPIHRNFGLLRAQVWPKDIHDIFVELWRCLNPDFGVLLFKWNDHDIKFQKVLSCIPVKPLFGQQVKAKGTRKYDTQTFWFCFVKKPKREHR